MTIDKLPIQNKKVSDLMVGVAKNVRDTSPQLKNLVQILKDTILHNTFHSAFCDKIAAEKVKTKRTTLKKELINIIVGGIFEGGTAKKNLVMRNLLIAFDFDSDSVEKAVGIKQYCLKKFGQNAVYIGYSVSMTGVHMILLINDDRKAEYWKAIENICMRDGVKVDSSTKDESRRLFLGNDKDCLINEDAEPFIVPEISYAKKTRLPMHILPDNQLEIILKDAKSRGLKFESGHRHEFILFVASQALGKGIKKEEAIRILNSKINLSATNEHLQTLEKIYKTQIDSFGKFQPNDKKNYMAIALDVFHAFYEIRHNLVKGRSEFRRKDTEDWIQVNDRELNSIVIFLNVEAGLSCSVELISRIINSKEASDYDPFVNYFTSLPPWDRTTDYISQLANTITTEDSEFFVSVLTKWLVGAVATATLPEVANHIVLLLIGEQGVGKSTWLAKLCPPTLLPYFYSGTIDPRNKDTLVYISECFLIELAEMANLTRSEHNELKDIVTKIAINTRVPYDRYAEQRTRRASFIGSVNDAEFLTDTTGNRRFLCFKVTTIDYSTKVNIDGVYAQAYQLLMDGYKFYFSPEEVQLINSRNEAYVQTTLEEEYLLEYCYPGTEEHTDNYWSATTIAEAIFKDAAIQINTGTIARLGKALAKNKFIKITKNSRKVYRVNMTINRNRPETDSPDPIFGLDWE